MEIVHLLEGKGGGVQTGSCLNSELEMEKLGYHFYFTFSPPSDEMSQTQTRMSFD
jgi:hypothetical protein